LQEPGERESNAYAMGGGERGIGILKNEELREDRGHEGLKSTFGGLAWVIVTGKRDRDNQCAGRKSPLVIHQ